MRDILFKAKRKDNGEWVEGWLLKDGVTGQYFIHASGNSVNESDKVNEEGCLRFVAFEVDENTICQYTGLTDKNGNKIWENDVVKCYSIDVANRENEFISNVYWDDCMWCVHEKECCDNLLCYFDMSKNWVSHIPEIEVIGNIFDNPELIGE